MSMLADLADWNELAFAALLPLGLGLRPSWVSGSATGLRIGARRFRTESASSPAACSACWPSSWRSP